MMAITPNLKTCLTLMLILAAESAWSVDLKLLDGFYVADVNNPDTSNMTIVTSGSNITLTEIDADGTEIVFVGTVGGNLTLVEQGTSGIVGRDQVRRIIAVNENSMTVDFLLSESITVPRHVQRVVPEETIITFTDSLYQPIDSVDHITLNGVALDSPRVWVEVQVPPDDHRYKDDVIETYRVRVTSGDAPQGIVVACIETSPASRLFRSTTAIQLTWPERVQP